MPTYRNDSGNNINVHELLVLPPGATYETTTTYNIDGLTEIDSDPVNSKDPLFKLEEISQADSPQTVSLHTAGFSKSFWQIQFELSATPTSGTATISVRVPGATNFVDFDTTVDLTSNDLLYTFDGIFEEIKITTSGLDADKTYNAYFFVS